MEQLEFKETLRAKDISFIKSILSYLHDPLRSDYGETMLKDWLNELEKRPDSTGADLIMKEREEQIQKHGKTDYYDTSNNNEYQLVEAAQFLIDDTHLEQQHEDTLLGTEPEGWDKAVWLKMCSKSYIERLAIAGALIAAEIDRVKLFKQAGLW